MQMIKVANTNITNQTFLLEIFKCLVVGMSLYFILRIVMLESLYARPVNKHDINKSFEILNYWFKRYPWHDFHNHFISGSLQVRIKFFKTAVLRKTPSQIQMCVSEFECGRNKLEMFSAESFWTTVNFHSIN